MGGANRKQYHSNNVGSVGDERGYMHRGLLRIDGDSLWSEVTLSAGQLDWADPATIRFK